VESAKFSAEIRAAVPDEADAYDSFERALGWWPERYRKARGAARYEERGLRETGQITARRQAMHLAASMALRIIDLGNGLIVLVNARHPHASYAVARAIFETCGVFSYLRRNVLPGWRKGRADRTAEMLERLRIGLDPGITFERPHSVTPVRVSKLVSALCTDADEHLPGDEGETAGETMAQLYSTLSDNTHPNMSAGHLSVTFDDDGYMDWVADYNWIAGELHEVIGTSYLAMHYGAVAFDQLMETANAHRLVLDDKRDD
jgi:hypothetical protein